MLFETLSQSNLNFNSGGGCPVLKNAIRQGSQRVTKYRIFLSNLPGTSGFVYAWGWKYSSRCWPLMSDSGSCSRHMRVPLSGWFHVPGTETLHNINLIYVRNPDLLERKLGSLCYFCVEFSDDYDLKTCRKLQLLIWLMKALDLFTFSDSNIGFLPGSTKICLLYLLYSSW